MKSGCESVESKPQSGKRSIELPVLANASSPQTGNGKSRTSRWRAGFLIVLTLLMIAHVIQWWIMGRTVSPIEPSEAMYTLQDGAVNAGFIFFTLAILATLIFGRFVCGWGCHIVALQDFSAWLLNKVGLKPKPFRSRLLVYVPLIVALYMFVWPTFYKWLVKPANEALFPQFTNHLITSDFWQTFPPVWVAIPFLFVCGFMTVYFLGSKGFCTYACPYGGFFAVADKVAPGKIRVTDACNQCGLCTANCMSNVQVHAEVKEYGMVIDPGCMKHMDCISVCPNEALYFGFGKPSVTVKTSDAIKPKYSLTWPEEILAAAVFFTSFMAVWDVYQLVPMLMALGISTVTTFLFVRSLQLFRTKDSAFYKYKLRSAGTIKIAGWLFLGFAVIWIGLNGHSGWVRYNERAAAIAYQTVQIPDELALARANPDPWLTPVDRQNVVDGKRHFYAARSKALFTNKEAISKLAWLEYLSGNPERGVELLAESAARQEGQPSALSLYYRGAILNRLRHFDEALASLDKALIEREDLVTAREERGESLWQLDRKQEAIAAWIDAVTRNPDLPISQNFLAGAASLQSNAAAAAEYEKRADAATPADALFHWIIGLRLQNLGMTALADKRFAQALKLDPKFRPRGN